MLDTRKSIEETKKEWEELAKEYGITDEQVMSSEYDYIEED